jgi:electron transport complex protein RnfG
VWHTRFGYGGSIDFAISFSEDAKNIVKKIVVLRHSETPGMGDKITIKKTNWITQFFNKTQELVRENIKNKKFDTITGATISSNGFAKAINKSLELWFAKEHNLKPNNDFAK